MMRLQDLLLASAAFGAVLAPIAAQAQDSVARPVVQALPDPAASRLTEVLRALARDPQSVPLLVEAGEASLKLDDLSAADGFFKRASAVSPNDARLKAGKAALMVRQGNPLEALSLFDEAERGGIAMTPYANDRGLAYDLVGDNLQAQSEYRRALASGADPAISMRLALSQSISGDQQGSEATLLPLLQRSDLAAYRTRAFTLAISGKEEEAVTIAQTMLPERISGRMAPYLRYMPRLTKAQQAAAANLGRFPRADAIGKDDPAIAAYAAQRPALAGVTGSPTAGSRLVPAGQPLGPAATASSTTREAARSNRERPGTARTATTAQVAAPARTIQPVPIPLPPDLQTAAAPAAVASPAAKPAPTPARAAVVASAPVASTPVTTAPARQAAPTAAVVSSPVAQQPVIVATLAPAVQVPPPAPPPPAPPPRDLTLAFAEFARPVPVVVSEGAVDISRIQVRRETPPPPVAAKPAVKPAPAPPPKPVIPSRHWVQVATGRDTGGLSFDWRRLSRTAGGLLDKYKPQIAKWGQTHRLLAGPFASAREAEQFVTKLKDKKLDSFRFTSDVGEEVKPLS